MYDYRLICDDPFNSWPSPLMNGGGFYVHAPLVLSMLCLILIMATAMLFHTKTCIAPPKTPELSRHIY
jgi:hypothetical protein